MTESLRVMVPAAGLRPAPAGEVTLIDTLESGVAQETWQVLDSLGAECTFRRAGRAGGPPRKSLAKALRARNAAQPRSRYLRSSGPNRPPPCPSNHSPPRRRLSEGTSTTGTPRSSVAAIFA